MLWKESPRGTSRMFFSLYIEVPSPHVPTTSFPLMVLWSKVVSVLQWNKHPNSKTQQKITYLLLYCVKSDWFYSIQIWSLKKCFICENRSKDTLNCSKLCGITMQLQKTFWLAFLTFFCSGTFSRIPLRPVLISI